MIKVYCLIVSLCIGLSLQASTPSSTTYEAGVVEFAYERNSNVTPAQRLATTRAEYLQIMTDAPSTLDVIVFPEMTLNGMENAVETPEPIDNISPCDSTDYPADNLLKQISCSAKIFQRYVVVNVVTKAACPDSDMIANEDPRNCTDRTDGMSYYNTNVVFDRRGVLISRYRKYNLFGESVDKPHKASMVSFETDFGVKFGHFVCFDLMFRFPALELVRNQSITDIIFPTMWFSELPFLTGVQVQQNWAFANNVNLLAAGANLPAVGSTGTGIYAGRKGSLASVMEGVSKTTLLTATVPKRDLGDSIQIVQQSTKNSRAEMAPLKLKRDQLDKYSIHMLEQSMTPGTTEISTQCHGELCCEFKYGFTTVATTQPAYRFGLAVYHGNRTFDGFADGGVVACAIIACQTQDIATCGVRNESYAFIHQWNTIEIKGVLFPSGDQFFYLPTSLDQSIMPFNVDEFNYQQVTNPGQSTHYNISMTAVAPVRDFYAFGIYGRDFNLDGPGAAGAVKISFIMVIASAAIATIRNLM